jgi:AraC-like DNA-binding protein
MDPIGEIVRSMHLTGGVFLDAEFTSPWCVLSKIGPEDCAAHPPIPRSIIGFHFVRSGRLFATIDGKEAIEARGGDIIALPHNDDHRLGSDVSLKAIDAGSLIERGENGKPGRINHGGGGEKSEIVCGFLGTDKSVDPVLVLLPRILKLNTNDGASSEWIDSSFRFAASQTTSDISRTPETLVKLAEALFMDAVRRYLETLPVRESGWCAGMRDPRIARALGLLHHDLARQWTADDLAHHVGLSRSAFAARFTRIVGQSPMRYLAQQRLYSASRRLNDSGDSIARVAFASGYESEAAFNRAFKREFGLPPATWRKEQMHNDNTEA